MKASECKCILCGRPAVAFWPVIDPDIPSNPYCRDCLDKTKMKMLIELQEQGLIKPDSETACVGGSRRPAPALPPGVEVRGEK